MWQDRAVDVKLLAFVCGGKKVVQTTGSYISIAEIKIWWFTHFKLKRILKEAPRPPQSYVHPQMR